MHALDAPHESAGRVTMGRPEAIHHLVLAGCAGCAVGLKKRRKLEKFSAGTAGADGKPQL
jgi:hypothetical protein